MRKLIALFIVLLLPLALFAQGGVKQVSGRVVEGDTQQPAIQAAVQFLNPSDSVRVEAAICDLEGNFSVMLPYGNYIVKISTVGYHVMTKDILNTPSSTALDLGTIILVPEARMLKAAVASAKVEPVTVLGDTVAYNAAAFRVPEDATLEELLKKIPGMEIHGSTVTLQGKPITQIFINGKRFFGNDVKAGLKSLDANMVEQIKAYERESDFTRLTGIEDGEMEDVLDIKIKKSMMDGFRGSVTGGYGRGHDESPLSEPQPDFNGNSYVGRGSLNKITKKEQININVGVSDIVGKGAFLNSSNNRLGSGSEGNRNNATAGVTMSKVLPKSEISGSAQFLDTRRDVDMESMSESLSSTINKKGERVFSSTQSESLRNRHADDGSVKANFNWEYNPVKQFTLVVKPTLQYNFNNAEFFNNGTSYNSSKKLTNNSNEHNTNQTKKIYGYVLGIGTYRFPKRGRTLTGRMEFAYNNIGQEVGRDIETHYYLLKSKVDSKQDSIRHIDYLQGNTDSYFKETVSASYSEPFAKRFYFQASVQFTAQQSKCVRDIYMPPSTMTYVPESSYLGNYEYYTVPTTLSVRYARKKFGATAGVKIIPQFGILNYAQQGIWQSTRTEVLNFAPELYLRYIKSKTEKLIFRYYSYQWAQSLYNLIPLEHGVQGLSIHKGNADLKPSFKHMVKLSYNKSNLKAQNSILLNADFDMTQNAVASSSEFSEITGARIYVPKNIDGNWNAKANMVFNQTFKNNHFSVTSNTVAQYNNTCNLLYNSALKEDEMNISNRLMIRESIDFTYRNDWFEGIVNLRGDWTDETSLLRPDMNQQPFNVCAGAEATFTLPWGMMINLNFSTVVQRGYTFAEKIEGSRYDEFCPYFNGEYYYLDTSISQPFFKKKFILRLEGVNLLDQNVNMVRGFSASSRSVSLYNGTGRYILLSAIFRFKL